MQQQSMSIVTSICFWEVIVLKYARFSSASSARVTLGVGAY